MKFSFSKLCFLVATVLLGMLSNIGRAQQFVNLTPHPKTMTVRTGIYTLPAQFSVGGASLGDSIVSEIERFVADFNKAATGVKATSVSEDGAQLKMTLNKKLPKDLHAEGYRLKITPQGVSLEAASRKGFYYGLMSLKKMLPACIAAGVKDEKVTSYVLPCVDITDAPRYAYRGYMLDVSRHFFSIEELKRLLDVMAIYKMNKFHLHLTDDQGWRWEVKQYPNLTRVGAIASNSYVTAMHYGAYWSNAQYGPFFYTQDELRDLVDYAKQRHIEIVPEIDMPGHFVAALAAYPEYSCTPEITPMVWTHGGVSENVLNVANPEAVQFAKNILTELMDIFPSPTIHVGGDECPTNAWQKNAECQALYKKLKLSDYRQLQNHFIAQIDEHVKARGRHLAVWNEAITSKGADVELMKKTGATVFCWTGAGPAADKAQKLRLPHVYTPQFPYYINRQSSKNVAWEESLPGNGSDDLKNVYNHRPKTNSLTIGVQGTFWTEHVATNDVLEYLTFPRLMAIAELGWTPVAHHNFSKFLRRMQADTVMLNYNNYHYGLNYLTDKPHSLPTPPNKVPSVLPENGKTYIVRCAVEGFENTALADEGKKEYPQHTTDERANIGWKVEGVTAYDANTKSFTLRLKNAVTNSGISSPTTEMDQRLGAKVKMGNSTLITATYNPAHDDFTLSAEGKNFYPVPQTAPVLAGAVCAGNKEGLGNAVRPQGAAWQFVPARKLTFVCYDAEGNDLGTIYQFAAQNQTDIHAPVFAGYELQSPFSPTASEQDETYKLTYVRKQYVVYLTCQDRNGGLLKRDTLYVPIGQTQTIPAPQIEFYTPVNVPDDGVLLNPTEDTNLTLIYSSEAFAGVREVAEPVSELSDGMSVLIYDTSINAPKRAGYRNVNPGNKQVMQGQIYSGVATPYFTWTLEKAGTRWKVKNEISDAYIPELQQSNKVYLSNNAGQFSFVLNPDKTTWKVQGMNKQYWDGAEGFMTGWKAYGHPYRLHRYFVRPYFGIKIEAVTEEDGTLLTQRFVLAEAGQRFTLVAPVIEGRSLVRIEGEVDDLQYVAKHHTLRCIYNSKPSAIEEVRSNSSTSSEVYDLSGRRVEPCKSGAYIVNGQKVIM